MKMSKLGHEMYASLATMNLQLLSSEETIVACHKEVLGTRSRVFRQMLYGWTMEASMPTLSVAYTTEATRRMVRFAYTDCLFGGEDEKGGPEHLPIPLLVELIYMGDFYEMADLSAEADRVLSKRSMGLEEAVTVAFEISRISSEFITFVTIAEMYAQYGSFLFCHEVLPPSRLPVPLIERVLRCSATAVDEATLLRILLSCSLRLLLDLEAEGKSLQQRDIQDSSARSSESGSEITLACRLLLHLFGAVRYGLLDATTLLTVVRPLAPSPSRKEDMIWGGVEWGACSSTRASEGDLQTYNKPASTRSSLDASRIPQPFILQDPSPTHNENTTDRNNPTAQVDPMATSDAQTAVTLANLVSRLGIPSLVPHDVYVACLERQLAGSLPLERLRVPWDGQFIQRTPVPPLPSLPAEDDLDGLWFIPTRKFPKGPLVTSRVGKVTNSSLQFRSALSVAPDNLKLDGEEGELLQAELWLEGSPPEDRRLCCIFSLWDWDRRAFRRKVVHVKNTERATTLMFSADRSLGQRGLVVLRASATLAD